MSMSGSLTFLSVLLHIVLSTVPFRERSQQGNYKLKAASVQAFTSLFDTVEGLRERCTKLTQSRYVYCESLTKIQILELLQQDDKLIFIDAMRDEVVQTVRKHHQGKRKRSVPWNLDRLNQISGILDGSYKDGADVDVYIIGSGIRVDHAEFGNRASVGFSAFDGSDDCDGSGTQLASLVGGNSMGIARHANLVGVKVVGCDGETNEAKTILGIQYVQEQILKTSDRRSVVLIGFTQNSISKDINEKIVSLTETSSGVLVIVGAGESDTKHDACSSTPASAQGATALNGVVSVGGIDEEDATVSNIGECVDLFAPGVDIPAAGVDDAIAVTSCSGSLCAAALATGVIAKALRDNSKIDIEVQKSMLINGATVADIKLPEDSGFDLTKLKSQTPRKILYYTCGYDRDSAPPVCESYTAVCNNSKVTTFDEVNVPLFQQNAEKCSFYLFKSDDNDASVIGSYHQCSLGAYTVSWLGNTILLLPGPTVFVNNNKMVRQGIQYEVENELIVTHQLDVTVTPHEPLVLVKLLRQGEEEISITFDCVSRLTITLVTPNKYDGKTGGLCGYYDEIGTNDYRLPDGTELSTYSTSYHEDWRTHDSEECSGCDGDGCPCEDAQCQEDAEQFCSDKFAGASSDCLNGVNVYKETRACVQEVAKCCCQAKEDGNASPDLAEECCQNSYFGNFERNRAHCDICDDSWCEKEDTHEHCKDNSNGKTLYDYTESVTYTPEDCCYYIPEHDRQICTAPRNDAMMWDKAMPVCQEKTCKRPDVPNDETIISPDKAVYQCGETVTVTCEDCHEINPSPQVIKCSAGDGESSNDAHWNEDIDSCQIITCPEPDLPDIDNDKSIRSPLSWIKSPVPHGNECGDSVIFECDICYEMWGEADATCEDDHRWTDSPRCRLRYCEHPANPQLEYPLAIRTVNYACNDSIEYACITSSDDVDAECYELDGDSTSSCRVDDDEIIGWDSDRPSCKIKHCPEFRTSDLIGEGYYRERIGSAAEEEYKRIWLTETGSDSPTECGSVVEVKCDECYYLCGPEKRTCLPNGDWSDGRPRCEIRNCRAPVNNAAESNALYTPSNGPFECGDTITFECKDDCYEYSDGTEVHTCQPDLPEDKNPYESKAMWDGNAYSCQIKTCSAIEAPQNGYFTTDLMSSDRRCGSVVSFSCDECYVLQGDSELKCQSDKTWSHEVPVCIKKECPAPIVPLHGAVALDDPKCGETVDYTCDNCYYLVGSNYSTCQDDRSWSHSCPKCELWECEQRESPENGHISNRNYHYCGDSVDYECDNCYEMSGDNDASCQHGGIWNNPAPTCNIKQCPKPAVPGNTAITPLKDSYNCGEYVKVVCDPCYELEAIDIHCLDGGWERDVPSCGLKKCEDPEPLIMVNVTIDYGLGDGRDLFNIVPAGLTSGVKNKCGDEVEYECDICYNLKGNKKIVCDDDKQWTEKPVCELKICDAPEKVTEHLVVVPDQQIYSCKEPIKYSCDDVCWSLEGSPERVCKPVENSNDTTWFPENPPHCEIRSCLPPLIEDDLVSHDGQYTCGSTIRYSCPSCFRLVGSDSATCTEDDEWDNPVPTCEPVCCPELEVIRSGDPTYDVEIMSYSYTGVGDDEQLQFCSGNHVCQQVDVTCQTCYEYIDQNSGETYNMAPKRECQHPDDMISDGDWTNKDKACSRKQCESRIPRNSQHINYGNEAMVNKVECGDKVSFECNECYENLDGTMAHTCQPDKQWSHIIPTCSLKECAELPVIENCPFTDGYRTCGAQRKLDCENCWYTDKCKAGLDADTSVVCNINKTWEWENAEPIIKIKTCDAPPVVEYASFVSDGTDYECDRLIKYECDECYEFQEAEECNCAVVKCEGRHETDCTKGTWVGTFPTCVPMMCEPLNTPANAHVLTRENGCKTKTAFECDKGYELVAGDLNRTCTTAKEWTGADPVCRIRNCTELDAPDHGSISTEDRHYGSVVTFHCNDCYKFPDSMTNATVMQRESVYPRYHILMCEEHGNWNGSEPICREKYCRKPTIPDDANLVNMNFYCGDEVQFTCNTGYYQSNGDNSHSCGTDSKWEGEPFECEEKTCVKPAEINHGSFSPKLDKYVTNSSMTYDCDYCYEATGQLDIICTDHDGSDRHEYAQWDPSEPPTCSRIQCPAQAAGPNSVLVPKRTGVETSGCSQVLEVVCSEGYEIKGAIDTVVCRGSGKWSRDLPTCEIKCCRTRDELLHGSITEHDDSQCFGDRITHECDTCFEMDGESSQTCQASGMWTDELPRCKRIICRAPTVIKKGSYSDNSHAGGCGSTRTFECDTGYTLTGRESLTCREDGQWSGEVPVCEPNPCSAEGVGIANGEYGAWYIGPTPAPGDDVTHYPHHTGIWFKCNDGYELIGLEDIFCRQDGTWSDPSPRCSKELCPELQAPAHGNVVVTNLKEGGVGEGGIGSFECDRCYRREGYDELHCNDGEWRPIAAPTCRENVCYPPGEEENSFIVGYNSSKVTYSCDEEVEYRCDDGYKLHGDTSRTCGETGQWTGAAPVCADVTCEPIPTPENGGMKLVNTSNINFWCNKGYQLGGDSELLCVKGQWQGVPPTCSKQVCGDPGTPEWGNKTGDSYRYGDVVSYQCNTGYQLRGVTSITCNHRGVWDYSPPNCVCNECPRLSQPANGYVQTTDSNAYNSIVQYTCYSGYEIIGTALRECTASGEWGGYAPTCERLNCTSGFEIPQDGYVYSDDGHSYEDSIEIRCNEKKGGWIRTCQADGTWSGEVPDRCDCRKAMKQVAVRKRIVKPATCQFGKCTPKTVRYVTVYEYREFTICD